MHRIGDQVIYGSHGVCRITGMEKQLVNKRFVTYLVLEPTGQTGTRYLVPTDNGAAMTKLRSILTREEMEALLRSDTVREGKWLTDENQRKQLYRELITSGDRVELMRMLCLLYRYRNLRTVAGKKIHLADENFLREAQRLISGEISAVMEMSMEDASTVLRERLCAE